MTRTKRYLYFILDDILTNLKQKALEYAQCGAPYSPERYNLLMKRATKAGIELNRCYGFADTVRKINALELVLREGYAAKRIYEPPPKPTRRGLIADFRYEPLDSDTNSRMLPKDIKQILWSSGCRTVLDVVSLSEQESKKRGLSDEQIEIIAVHFWAEGFDGWPEKYVRQKSKKAAV